MMMKFCARKQSKHNFGLLSNFASPARPSPSPFVSYFSQISLNSPQICFYYTTENSVVQAEVIHTHTHKSNKNNFRRAKQRKIKKKEEQRWCRIKKNLSKDRLSFSLFSHFPTEHCEDIMFHEWAGGIHAISHIMCLSVDSFRLLRIEDIKYIYRL